MNEASEADRGRGAAASTTPRASGNDRLLALEVIVGFFAGLAALIYIMGGVALGLRLLFAGLPSLPVGQLPREFLFSLGAAQVVVPAAALAIAIGLIELGAQHRGLVWGHLPWSEAKKQPGLGRTYIVYYAAVPFLLIAPGLAVAVIGDDAVDHQRAAVVVLAVAVAIASGAWFWFASSSQVKNRRERPEVPPTPNRNLWFGVLGGAIVPIAFAIWLSLEVEDARYAGVFGAWFVSLLFALLVVWWRAQVGERHRRDAAGAVGLKKPPEPSERKKIADVPASPLLVVLSWAATAVLLMPALVAITAAWPLSEAVVCTEPSENTTYAASGRFVGETKDHVYIGEETTHQIISVPSSNVSRLLVGREAAHTQSCERRRNGPA